MKTNQAERIEGLLNQKSFNNFKASANEIIKDLTIGEGFDENEVVAYLYKTLTEMINNEESDEE